MTLITFKKQTKQHLERSRQSVIKHWQDNPYQPKEVMGYCQLCGREVSKQELKEAYNADLQENIKVCPNCQ